MKGYPAQGGRGDNWEEIIYAVAPPGGYTVPVIYAF